MKFHEAKKLKNELSALLSAFQGELQGTFTLPNPVDSWDFGGTYAQGSKAGLSVDDFLENFPKEGNFTPEEDFDECFLTFEMTLFSVKMGKISAQELKEDEFYNHKDAFREMFGVYHGEGALQIHGVSGIKASLARGILAESSSVVKILGKDSVNFFPVSLVKDPSSFKKFKKLCKKDIEQRLRGKQGVMGRLERLALSRLFSVKPSQMESFIVKMAKD